MNNTSTQKFDPTEVAADLYDSTQMVKLPKMHLVKRISTDTEAFKFGLVEYKKLKKDT